LIIGIIVSFVTLIAGNIGMVNAIGGPAYLFGDAAVITMPVFYGIMGFVLGLIIAVIYNLIAGFIGGLEIDLETDSKT
jgi:hypothetical protein